MSHRIELERSIAAWMADEARAAADGRALDQILTSTARQRPQPRWLVLLKEPPMRINTRVAVGSPTRRLVLIAAVALLALGAAAAVAATIMRPGPTDDWPGIRGGAARTNAGQVGPIGQPLLQWRYQAPGQTIKAISLVGDIAIVPSDDGTVAGVTLDHGAAKWSNAPVGGATTGAFVADGRAFLADGEGHPYAINPSTGAVIWRSPTTVGGPSEPLVLGGLLVIGDADGNVVALDATTGNERWSVAASSSGAAVHAPAGDGDRIVVSTDGELIGLDAATGVVAWRVDLQGDLTATPVLADGAAFVGVTGDADAGHLWAVDLASGAVRWTLEGPWYAPAIAGTVGYTGNTDGTIAAIELGTGHELWHVQFDSDVRPPATAAGVVYVAASAALRVYALDGANGGELWHFDVDGSNQCCIEVAGGRVVVGSVLGGVYAIGGDGATASPGVQPSVATVPAVPPTSSSGTPSGSPAASDVAEFVAQIPPPDGEFAPTQLARAPDDTLWVVNPLSNRFALFEDDGTFREYWGGTIPGAGALNLVRSNGDGYGGIAFADDGSFVVLDCGNFRVLRFDADRKLIGSFGEFGSGTGQFSDPVGIQFDADGNILVLDDSRGVIEQFNPTGDVIGVLDPFEGRNHGFNTANGFTVGPDGSIYVALVNPNEVVRMRPDGTIEQRYGSAGSGAGALVDQPGYVAIDERGDVIVSEGPTDPARSVLVYAADGTYLGAWGSHGTGDGEFGFATGVVVRPDQSVVVGDVGGAFGLATRLQIFRLTVGQ